MILVTGGTGFIGRALVRRLVRGGSAVRCLIRPSRRPARLPAGVTVEVAVARLDDVRGVRAALSGCNAIIHLASAEWAGRRGDLFGVDVRGTRVLTEAAVDAGVQRFLYVSHLAADRASAYPALKAKGICEETIRQSGLNYTILRSALVYGLEDAFTNGLALGLRMMPFAFPLPGNGRTLLQPLWVEDLAGCLEWSLEDADAREQTVEVGGPEFFRLEELIQILMTAMGKSRRLVNVPAPYLRLFARLAESVLPGFPLTERLLDHLSVNRTAELVSVNRTFGLKPARFELSLDYLKTQRWPQALRRLFSSAG